MMPTPDRHNTENKLYTAIQNQQLESFVKRNIKALECMRAVPKDPTPTLCYCGCDIAKHKDPPDTSGRKWDAKTDLKEITSNAYGEMKLSGFRVLAGISLQYIRASQSGDLNANLYKLMTHYWDIRKPDLIISINGGAKKMIPLNNEQKSAFKRGLINVSKTASTWIITGGFNFGVSKLVGEAAKDYNIASQEKTFTVLGIGTWGAVYNRQDLVVKYPNYKAVYNNAEGQFNLKGQAPLDPNHDAFILYDCGIEGAFGKEIQFRTEFEMYVSKIARCSVVQVIVEGGKKCIETADEALRQGIPVVVMKGSKRAADLICDVIESDETTMEDIIDTGLSRYEVEWAISSSEEATKLKNHLISLHEFKKNKKIHIFSMSDFTKNLDRAILEAAFSGEIEGKAMTHDDKLKLAMTFNRPDVAEECILENASNRNQFTDYGEFIQIALKRNQWKFVNMFLSRGTQVESFLTRHLLESLYFGDEANKDINASTRNIIGYLQDTVTTNNLDKLPAIGLIVRKLTKNLIHNLYPKSKRVTGCCSTTTVENDEDVEVYKVVDFDKYLEPVTIRSKVKSHGGCCDSCTSVYEESSVTYTQFPPVNQQLQRIYTEQDLFIWAILTQRWEMAKIFWENGKDHIGSALIACVICNSLSKIANKEGEMEMALSLQNNRDDFENLAINILTATYIRDKTRTHLLLIRALPYWGRVTCMEIANKCQLVNFLAHSACQTRLNSIWNGGMSMYTSTILFLVNLPLAFITTKGLIFRSKRTENFEKEPLLESTKISTETTSMDMDVLHEAEKSPNNYKAKPKKQKDKEYLAKFRKSQQLAWQNVTFCEAVSYYYRAPVTKFTMHVISYLLFLAIYTYMCLVELKPLNGVDSIAGRQMEYAVYTYILSFILEEIRQSVADSQFDTFQERIIDWASQLWNIYDLIVYVMFTLAFILRFFTGIDFVYARTTYSVALSMFYMRFLQFYYASRTIGPKVISVSKMIKDIGFFFALYVVAIFAYGTFAQALLFSNSPINGLLLKSIVYMPFFQSYGDLHLEYVEGNVTVNNVTPTPNAIVIVAFVIYMLFVNTLLMNLLIAMFGMSVAKVEENSNRIWAFNRYQLVEEFYFRPILPPPLNFFEIIWMVLRWCKYKCRQHKKLTINDFVVNLTHDEDLRSAGFEQQCLEVYLLENPLLKPFLDTDANATIINLTAENEPKGEKSVDLVNLEKLDQWMSTVNNQMNEMKLEMKNIMAQVHKVRRHQKRDTSLSRPQTTIRDTPKNVQRVLPIDNDDAY